MAAKGINSGSGSSTTVTISGYAGNRFVIAHEIGHWYHQNWMDAGINVGYDYCVEDDPCLWGDVSLCDSGRGAENVHALRTAEHGNGAAAEGFAHFFATWVFDNHSSADALFKYYKEIPEDHEDEYLDLMEDNSRVSMLGGTCVGGICPLGGKSAWVENECPNDWDNDAGPGGVTDEVSSELDWMRFFWQFTAAEITTHGSPPPITDFLDLLSLAQDEAGFTPYYHHYYSAVSDMSNSPIHDYLDRFEELAIDNGVDNGGV